MRSGRGVSRRGCDGRDAYFLTSVFGASGFAAGAVGAAGAAGAAAGVVVFGASTLAAGTAGFAGSVFTTGADGVPGAAAGVVVFGASTLAAGTAGFAGSVFTTGADGVPGAATGVVVFGASTLAAGAAGVAAGVAGFAAGDAGLMSWAKAGTPSAMVRAAAVIIFFMATWSYVSRATGVSAGRDMSLDSGATMDAQAPTPTLCFCIERADFSLRSSMPLEAGQK